MISSNETKTPNAFGAEKPEHIVLDVDPVLPIDFTDLRTLVSKLKGQDYDAYGVYLGPGQIQNFYREYAQQNLSTFTFGTDFFESENQARQAGAAINGAVFVNHPVNENLAKRYKERYGNDIQMPSVCLGYDLVNFLYQVFEKEDYQKISADQIMKLLTVPSRDFSGVSGDFKFVATARGDKYYSVPLVVREIRDYRLVDAD